MSPAAPSGLAAPESGTRPCRVPYAVVSHGIRWFVVLLGAGLAGFAGIGIIGADLPPAARASLGVTSLSVGLMASELVALPVTALLAMVLLFVAGAVPQAEQAFTGFGSPVLFFLLGSAALGVAGEHTGLADRFAAWLLARSQGSGRRLLLDLLLSLPLQALVVPSAISRNAVLVPIYERLLEQIGRPPRLGAAVMLTLGMIGPIASSSLLSGGTVPVITAHAIGGFTWISWFVSLTVPYYALVAISGLVVWLLARPEETFVRQEEVQLDRPGSLSGAEWRVAAVTVVTSILWILDQLTHWPPAIPALIALVLLLMPRLGVMRWREFSAHAPWANCLILAGVISLADSLTRTGAAAWISQHLFGWFPAPDGPVAMALVIFAVTALISLVIPSRSAAIVLCIPLATAYAASGSLPAAAAGLVAMIAIDVETLYPAQTVANLMAYDRGYFGPGDLLRCNLIMIVAAAAIVAFVALPWWSLTGLPGMR